MTIKEILETAKANSEAKDSAQIKKLKEMLKNPKKANNSVLKKVLNKDIKTEE